MPELAVATDTLTAARAYVGDGWSVIPLRPGDKRPAVAWEPFQHRRPTDTELTSWFGVGENNLGIVTDEISRLVVADLDGDNGEASYNELEWPIRTRQVVTWSGGVHLYFSHPGHTVKNAVRLRPGLDIRGDGGYVVAPPSVIQGGSYAWLTPLLAILPLPAMPEEAKPEGVTRSAQPTSSQPEPYVRAALAAELRRVATATEGTRNDELNAAAFAIARFAADGRLPRAFVERAFLAAAARAGLPEREATDTIRSALGAR